MILIISNKNDRQADRVELMLRDNDASYSRLNLDPESLKSMQVTFEEDALRIDGPSCSFSTDDIGVIWNRTFRNEPFIESNFPNREDYLVLKALWDKALEKLFSLPESVKWLNFFYDFYSETQIGRYSFSKNIGFKWPYYICSNDINALNEFFEYKKDRILVLMNQPCRVKAVSDCTVESGNKLRLPYSGKENEVECLTDSSAYEVRCTVVGKEYFVAKIKPDSIKCRGIASNHNYYPIVYPPKSIKTRTIQIMNELNLTHGIFDFIVDENQEWFFDALNPMGKYRWIEDMRSPDISVSIAKWLMENNLIKIL